MNQLLLSFILIMTLSSCKKSENGDSTNTGETKKFYKPSEFVMGADLSYVNQILDHGGVYKDSGNIADPYQIFRNMVPMLSGSDYSIIRPGLKLFTVLPEHRCTMIMKMLKRVLANPKLPECRSVSIFIIPIPGLTLQTKKNLPPGIP